MWNLIMAFVVLISPDGIGFRGGNRAFYHDTKSTECIVSGPAETGKTVAACHKLHYLCATIPRVQAAIIRQVRADMPSTVLQTWGRAIQPAVDAGAVKVFGGTDPGLYQYCNGSEVWIAGMDRPGKVLSGQFDFVYVNQAEELSLAAWETITTRCTGRAGNALWHQVMGDCNPGAPWHWILDRARAGKMTMFESRHEDNPRLWSGSEWTAAGNETIRVLDNLSGVRLQRLRYGKWAGAEGLIYEDFDRASHVIPRFEVPRDWERFLSIDFGYTNPLVIQWWARDNDGRLYRYREIYQTKTLVEDAARKARELSQGESIAAVVCDHDAEDRHTFTRHFDLGTFSARKEVSVGLQSVSSRLRSAGDGKRRMYFLRDSLVHRDPDLVAAHLPTCTEDEFEGYVWKDNARKEEPLKENDHGMDAMRYAVMFVDRSRTVIGRWA